MVFPTLPAQWHFSLFNFGLTADLSCLGPVAPVQCGNPAGEIFELDILKTTLSHELSQCLLVGEDLDGVRQVSVGMAVPGNGLADPREDPEEIKLKEEAEKGVCGAGKFQDYQAASGFQHPAHFFQAGFQIFKVAKAERNGDSIKTPVRNGERQCIRLEDGNGGNRVLQLFLLE